MQQTRPTRTLRRTRTPFRHPWHLGIGHVPGVAARGIEDRLRPERRRIVEAADIDADHVGDPVRLVVDRRAAGWAKAFPLDGAAVTLACDLAHLSGDGERRTWKHEHRSMAAAGILLAVPTLALEGTHWGSRDV